MSEERNLVKQVITKQEMEAYLDKGPKNFYDDVTEFINDCQTLFERMFDLYHESLGAKIAQIGVKCTVTINEELALKMLSKNGNPVVCDWTFGCTGPLNEGQAAKAEKEMKL